MRKIPTLFVRDPLNPKRLTEEVTPGCEWVIQGHGIATAKLDGTAVLVDEEGGLWKRFDAKHGKPLPERFMPAEEEPDPVTGHFPGWIPVFDRPEDKWHRRGYEAAKATHGTVPPGTYELVGPGVQGNPHGLDATTLLPHGTVVIPLLCPDGPWPVVLSEFEAWLALLPYEGLVFYHADGRRAKIKRRDFGLPWPLPEDVEGDAG